MNYPIITIEREYASGGREIGEQAARLLNIPCYSSKVLELAAKQTGVSMEYMEKLDETAPNSLLYTLAVMAQPITYASRNRSPEHALQEAEAKIIRGLADHGSCVIIGRCAGAILRGRTDVLRVFIRADLQTRRCRAVEVYGEDSAKIDLILKKHDRIRSEYYNFFSEQRWNDQSEYHLMLDSGKLGVEHCAHIVTAAAG